jgi:hypothetical protein
MNARRRTRKAARVSAVINLFSRSYPIKCNGSIAYEREVYLVGRIRDGRIYRTRENAETHKESFYGTLVRFHCRTLSNIRIFQLAK